MSNLFRVDSTTAAIEWEFDGLTCSLVTPDPTYSPIQFTLRLDSLRAHGQLGALFEVIVPIRFKDKGEAKALYLRISPLTITSFDFSTKTDPSDSIKTAFNSATMRLDFTLDKTIAVLVPSYLQMPVTAARLRSGVVLDALRKLSKVHHIRIYIKDGSVTADQLCLIKQGISQRTIEPLSGPDYDISRMFGGGGAKPVDLSLPQPPSYETAAAVPPPAPSSDRKRPRQDSVDHQDHGNGWILTRFRELESLIMAKVEKRQAEPESTKRVKVLEKENMELRQKVARLEDRLFTLEKRQETLEEDTATLKQVQQDRDDEEDTQLLLMREDIESLQNRADWIERGKDEEAFTAKFRREIFDELAARVAGG